MDILLLDFILNLLKRNLGQDSPCAFILRKTIHERSIVYLLIPKAAKQYKTIFIASIVLSLCCLLRYLPFSFYADYMFQNVS